MDKTGIQWTEATWNPVSGCSWISAGCDNCYAKKVTEDNPSDYPNGFDITLHPERLEQPLRWTRPRRIFVNSMSDLFHKDIPLEYVRQCFDVMNRADQHVFQILTKRPSRALFNAFEFNWTKNIWMGTSVENDNAKHRINSLIHIPAAVRFLSIEPMIGPIVELDLAGIHWVIVGGESGPNARPMEESWALRIRDLCREQNVKFFFKQMGGTGPDKGGNLLAGEIYEEFPETT